MSLAVERGIDPIELDVTPASLKMNKPPPPDPSHGEINVKFTSLFRRAALW